MMVLKCTIGFRIKPLKRLIIKSMMNNRMIALSMSYIWRQTNIGHNDFWSVTYVTKNEFLGWISRIWIYQ